MLILSYLTLVVSGLLPVIIDVLLGQHKASEVYARFRTRLSLAKASKFGVWILEYMVLSLYAAANHVKYNR